MTFTWNILYRIKLHARIKTLQKRLKDIIHRLEINFTLILNGAALLSHVDRLYGTD